MILFAFSKFKYVYCCYFYFMVLVYLLDKSLFLGS